MIAASVGFQCPDDVRRGAAEGRVARPALGAAVALTDARVTAVLVGVNVLVYLLGFSGALPDLTLQFGNLALAQDGGEPIGVAAGQYYRLLSAAFLHAGFFHVASNMFALVTVGPQLEAALGRGRFLVLYLLSALGGSTLSYLVSDPSTLGVGASGAIFGLFGAYYVVVRRLGGDTRAILTLIVLNLVITFTLPIIDWRAHLGGLVTGVVVAAAFAYAPRTRAGVGQQVVACVAVLALLVAAVVLRTSALQS